MQWIDNPKMVRCLPWPYRLFAFYCRSTRRVFGRIRADRRALRGVIGLSRRLGIPDRALIEFPNKKMMVDLRDHRMVLVLDEGAGIDPETKLIQDILRPGDTFFDIGANHGTHAITAAKRVGNGGRVIAFEPQARLANMVAQSADANALPQLTVRQLALSDRAGTAEFFVPNEWSGIGGFYKNFSNLNGSQSTPVETARLDDLMAGEALPGKLVIKLDVEGHELPVLQGAEKLIRRYRPYILVELNPATQNASGHSGHELLTHLMGLGYSRFSKPDSPDSQQPLSELLAGSEFGNVLLHPPQDQS